MAGQEVLGFNEEQKSPQVACLGRGGRPHLFPPWFGVHDRKLVFETYTRSQKIVNLRRDPRITVLLEDGLEYERLRGVMSKGTATLVDDEKGLHDLARAAAEHNQRGQEDRQSTRPNSRHGPTPYADCCVQSKSKQL